MKSTKAKLNVTDYKVKKEGDIFFELNLRFELHEEDFQIMRETLNFINGRRDITLAPVMDEADYLLALITEGLHRYKEMKDGKPFVLRMDRKPKDPNKA